MQNLFGLYQLNKFHIMSKYDPFIFNCIYCTFSLCFTLYIFGYWKMSEILVIFSLFKFIVSYIISFSYYRQTNFSDHTNSFYSVSLHTYVFRNIVRKNMQIMFEKLYETHLGSATRICSIQFLEHDLHIFALF